MPAASGRSRRPPGTGWAPRTAGSGPTARARPRRPRRRYSRASRDFPIPAGPSTVTRCGWLDATARSHAERISDSSWSRPTSGVCEIGRVAVRGSPTEPGRDRLALALRQTGGSSSYRTRGGSAAGLGVDDHASRGRRVLQPRGRVHHVAGRERVLGRRVDRDHGLPVHTPARTARARPGCRLQLGDPVQDRVRGADGALGVLALASGAPNTAMTASPMYFSTMPPCFSIRGGPPRSRAGCGRGRPRGRRRRPARSTRPGRRTGSRRTCAPRAAWPSRGRGRRWAEPGARRGCPPRTADRS